MDHEPGENEPIDAPDRRALLTVTGRDERDRALQLGIAAVALGFVAILVAVPATLHVSGVKESLGALAGKSWDVVGFSAAIGLASAAIVQIGKQILGVRSLWQRRWVESWIYDRCAVPALWKSWLRESSYQDSEARPDEGFVTRFARAQGKAAFDELQAALLGSYARRDLRRIFDLPVEQLCALLSTAVDHALLNPRENAELLLAFSGPAGLGEIDQIAPPRSVHDVRVDRSPDDNNALVVVDATGSDDQSQPRALANEGDAASLARIARDVRSGLDVLQASIGQQWARAVRTWAVGLSGALGLVVVMFISITPLQRVLFAVAALLLGGFFAWVVRDLTAIVERARR